MEHKSCFIFILFILLSPSLLWGNEFRLIPSVSLKEEYNDNVLLSTDTVKTDYITTLSGGIELVNRTDRFHTDLLLRLDQLEYAKNNEFSATDQLYKGKFRYLATPRLNISTEAGFMRKSNPNLDIETTGIVLQPKPWNQIFSSLNADYQLNENTAGMLSYAYNRGYYENTNSGEDTSHEVNAGLIYDFGKYLPAVKGRMNMGYLYDHGPDFRIDNITGTIGFSNEFNEMWSILIDSGIRRTWSESQMTQQVFVPGDLDIPPHFQSVQRTVDNDDWGWVGTASLQYAGERSNGIITYSRDIKPTQGLNGAAERNALTLSARHQFTHGLTVFFSAGYSQYKSDRSEFSAETIDQETFRVKPRICYEFSKNISSEAYYSYNMVEYPESNTSAEAHIVAIALRVQHPLFE